MAEHIGADEARRLLDAATPLLQCNLRITTTQDCLFGEPDVEDDTYCVYDADEDDPPIVDRIVLPEVAELMAAAPRLAAEVVRLNEQLDTLRSGAWPVRVESLRIIAAWADAYVPSHGDALRSIADGVARLLAAAGGGVPEEGA